VVPIGRDAGAAGAMAKKVDVDKIIQSGSRSMDLGDLARMGHRKVRVIDEARIRELIDQAVQLAIDSEDHEARNRRVEAEKTSRDLKDHLARVQSKLQEESLAAKEAERLRDEVEVLKSQLNETADVIETEKQRIAEESQKKFQKLLREATSERQAQSGAYNKALRQIIESAERPMGVKQIAALKPLPPSSADSGGELLQRLNERVVVLGKMLESATGLISTRDQDIALAAAEHRRLQEEVRKLREDNKTLGEGAAQAMQLGADLQTAIEGLKGSLAEDIGRQVAWAVSSKKTGAQTVDAGAQLDAVLGQEVETNIDQVQVVEKRGKALTDTLAKLRRAKGGGT
jgi:hypothetical protein